MWRDRTYIFPSFYHCTLSWRAALHRVPSPHTLCVNTVRVPSQTLFRYEARQALIIHSVGHLRRGFTFKRCVHSSVIYRVCTYDVSYISPLFVHSTFFSGDVVLYTQSRLDTSNYRYVRSSSHPVTHRVCKVSLSRETRTSR